MSERSSVVLQDGFVADHSLSTFFETRDCFRTAVARTFSHERAVARRPHQIQ